MLRLQTLLYIVLLASTGWSTRAQMAQSIRLEIPASPDNAETFDVTPLADQGLLVTTRSNSFFDNTPVNFTFRRYDTQFKTLWQIQFQQESKFRPLLSYANDLYVYQLFRDYDSDRFQFMRLHLYDGTIERFDGTLLDQFDVQHFKVMGNHAFVGGYRHNRPVVMAFSFFDRLSKVLPGLYVNHLELSSLEVDETRQEVTVLVHSTRRHCAFSLITYDYDSRLLRKITFDETANNLITGKLLPVNEQESLLVGNYSTDCTPYSQGIYVTRIQHNEPADAERPIQYIEFSQLQNFFNYLKPQRQQKLRAKAERKKKEGKDYKFRYRLLVHDLIPTPDGLTLVAEVYYPQYRGNTLPSSGYLRGSQRLEGYRYTHAFVCSFDKRGNLLWDNCLPIKELHSFDLSEMVQLSQQGDRTVLAYPNDGEITMGVIQRNNVLKEIEKFKLLTNTDNERVTFSAQDNLMAWYGRHFLAYGFQKITLSTSYSTTRDVFYLNKLTYDPDAHPAKSVNATTRKNAGSD